jgi:hypothetical protein
MLFFSQAVNLALGNTHKIYITGTILSEAYLDIVMQTGCCSKTGGVPLHVATVSGSKLSGCGGPPLLRVRLGGVGTMAALTGVSYFVLSAALGWQRALCSGGRMHTS